MLRNLADAGRIPHALLLSGISGIGKFRLARAFAQYVHCHNHINGDSCGLCPSCIQHTRHNNPDLHFVFPVTKNKKLSLSTDYIDQWKEMLDNWSYMPPEKWNELLQAGNSQPAIFVSESEDITSRAAMSAYQESFKIFLIWLPEKMRQEAANKLLKIIEEPFEDTLFILVSNDDSKLLPTIYSRSQRIVLHPLSEVEIAEQLKRQGIPTGKVLKQASRLAEGSLAKADELTSHPEEMIEFSDLFKETMRMAYGLKAQRMKQLSEEVAAFGREKNIRFLRYCSRMVRENFIYNMRMPQLSLMTEDETAFATRFSPFIHVGNVEALNDVISQALNDIERNANAKIVMFDLFLLISQWVRIQKPTPLPL